MLHFTRCRKCQSYWSIVKDFILELGFEAPEHWWRARLFGVWKRNPQTLGNAVALGIYRHAWQALYKHFTKIETENRPFVTREVARSFAYKLARALRWRVMDYTKRETRTSLSGNPPASTKALSKMKPLAKIDPNTGEYLGMHPALVELLAQYEITDEEIEKWVRRRRELRQAEDEN